MYFIYYLVICFVHWVKSNVFLRYIIFFLNINLNIINKLKKTKWLKKYDTEYSCVNKATIASPGVDILKCKLVKHYTNLYLS